jgi:hypothetical protein
MTDNVVNFPKKETVDADTILASAAGKLEDCVIIGITKDEQLYTGICAESSEQVIYLLRVLEHLIISENVG